MKKENVVMRRKVGFTLVELIIVIAVIGVLAAILIPTFANVIDKANAKSALSDAKNTVTNYVTAKLTDDTTGGTQDLPENVVIFVQKAGKYYLYGYNFATSEELMQSSTPVLTGTLDEIITEYNLSGAEAAVAIENGVYEGDKLFYLVSNTETNPPIKAFGTKSVAEQYRRLNADVLAIGGKLSDNVDVFYGQLLPGKFEYANNSSGGNGAAGGTVAPVPTPTPEMVDITLNPGTCAEGSFDASKVSFTGSGVTGNIVKAEKGKLFTPANYGATYAYNNATEAGYIFDGWAENAFVVSGPTSITATWEYAELETYTLTFDKGEGDSMTLADGNNLVLPKGTDITNTIINSTATKANAEFIGWKCGEMTYAPDYSGVILLTEDMTFVAQFNDVGFKVTYKSGDGTGSDFVVNNITAGTSVNTLSFGETGFTAPANKVFYKWVSNSVKYGEGALLTSSISGDIVVTATYIANEFTVEYSTEGTSHIDSVPSGKQSYEVGTASVTLSGVNTEDYYYVASYNTTAGTVSGNTLNTSGLIAGTRVVITPVAASKTATIGYTTAHGTAPTTANITNLAENHSNISLPTLTEEGWTFDGWTVTTGSATISGGKLSISNPSGNSAEIQLTAQWTEVVDTTVQVVASKYPTTVDGAITINGTATDNARFEPGTEVTIAVNGSTGDFGAWLVNGHEVSTGATYTFTTEADKDVYVVASYKVAPEGAPEVWNDTTDSTYSGSGTSSDPYLITNAEELAGLNSYLGTSHQGKYFKLTSDIYLNTDVLNTIESGDSAKIAALNPWTPIGTSAGSGSGSFYGHFDGAGYGIYGMYINDLAVNGVGLFGSCYYQDQQIKNLTVADAYIHGIGNNKYVGGIAGFVYGAAITNCTFNGKIVIGNTYTTTIAVGGILGLNETSPRCVVNDCRTYGSISGAANPSVAYGGIGGIVGANQTGTININRCQNYATVASTGDKLSAGGIMGSEANQTNFTDCINYGDVSATGTQTSFGVGGILGKHNGYAITITKCANKGNVTSNKFATGGILGYTAGSSSKKPTVSYCYNTGDITATGSVTWLSGIIGRGSYATCSNCYTVGTLTTAGTRVGGVFGGSAATATSVTGCTVTAPCYYLNGCTTKTIITGTGTAKDRSEIISTFEAITGYFAPDVGNVNDGYPVLATTPASASAPTSGFEATHRTDVVTLVFMNGNTYSSKIVAPNGSSVTIPTAISGKTGWKLNGTVQTGSYTVNGDKTFMAY